MPRTARAQLAMTGDAERAAALWLAVERWPDWVDGVAEIESVDPSWPAPGAEVVWGSVPAGRGRVRERIVSYEQATYLVLEVADDTLTGSQSVRFDGGAGTNLRLELELSYRPRNRSPLMPLIDAMFVRSAVRRSLQVTLGRFGALLAADGPGTQAPPRP